MVLNALIPTNVNAQFCNCHEWIIMIGFMNHARNDSGTTTKSHLDNLKCEPLSSSGISSSPTRTRNSPKSLCLMLQTTQNGSPLPPADGHSSRRPPRHGTVLYLTSEQKVCCASMLYDLHTYCLEPVTAAAGYT